MVFISSQPPRSMAYFDGMPKYSMIEAFKCRKSCKRISGTLFFLHSLDTFFLKTKISAPLEQKISSYVIKIAKIILGLTLFSFI